MPGNPWEQDALAPPEAPSAALTPWKNDPIAASANVAREAAGPLEAIQAGWQGSAPGLAWRGKLPDLVTNPEHSRWWERALTGVTQVAAELPLMVAGSAVGAPAGAALGTAVSGPAAPAGAAIGSVLGAGAGMFMVPAALRETLMQAYKSGDISTAADFWNILREVATTTAKEGAIGAATMGAGGLAARAAGSALVPAIGTAVSVPTAIKAIGGADVAAQIATMTTMPAAFQGRLPDAQEVMDAAIVIGGLKAAHSIAGRIADVYAKTGKTPAEQVADAKEDPSIAADLIRNQNAERTGTASGVPYKLDRLIAQAQFLGTGGVNEADARTIIRNAAAEGKLAPQQNATALDATLARAEFDWQIPWAPDVKALIRDIKATGPMQGDLLTDVGRLEKIADEVGGKAETVVNPETHQAEIVTTPPRQLTAPERTELETLRTRINAGLHTAEVSRETGLQSIYEDVRSKMLAAGRPVDEATAIATIERERYRARGARIGEDPSDLYFRKPLQIRGEEPPAPETEGWTKLKPGPGIPGIKPPDTYERQDDVGTRTMRMRDGRVQSDRSVGDYVAIDSNERSVDVRVTKDHITGKTIASTGFDDNRDITPLLDSGVPLLDALKRTFSTRDAPDVTKKPTEPQTHGPMRGLEDPEVADLVKAMAYEEAGWLTVGGKLDIARMVEEHGPGILDEYGRPTKLGVVAFTKWIPKADWWADRPDKNMNEAKYRKAIDKALAGEKLTPAEQRAIDYLTEIANKRLALVEQLGPEEFAATAADVTADVDGGPTTDNIIDADAVARVAAFDESIVERLSTEHANDDVAFMRAINEILQDLQAEEEARTRGAAGAGGATDTGAAPGEAGDNPLKRYEQRRDFLRRAAAVLERVGEDKNPDGTGGRVSNETAERLAKANDKDAGVAALLAYLGDDFTKLTGDTKLKTAAAKALVYEVKAMPGTRTGPLYRVMAFATEKRRDAFLKKMEAGEITGLQAERPVMSFTTDDPAGQTPMGHIGLDVASQFGEHQVIVKVQPQSGETLTIGRDISRLYTGALGGGAPGLDVLVPRDTQFRLRAIEERDGTPWVVLEPTKGQEGAVLFQRKSEVAPIWYSELARKLDEAKMEQAPAKGWKDYIRGLAQKGVKPDEVKWSGIEDWLDAQDGKVTKEQVKAFLEQGGVRVQEVMLGGKGSPSLSDPAIARDVATLREFGWQIDQNPEDDGQIAFWDEANGDMVSASEIREWASGERTLEDIADAAERVEQHWYRRSSGQPTRYSNYVLPGGENYRELLLTLPARTTIDRNTMLPAGYHIEEMQGGNWTLVTPDGSGKILAYLNPNAPRWVATEEAIRVLRHEGVISAEAPAFHSSHFDQPNIATHIRFTDRITGKTDLADIERRLMEAVGVSKASSLASGAPDVAIRKGLITPEEAADWSTARGMQNDYKDKPGTGSKVLFVEEIQSDWAQKGKKEGFGDVPRYTVVDGRGNLRGDFATREEAQAYLDNPPDAIRPFMTGQMRAPHIKQVNGGGIPKAPFVEKTDAWTALALKRMIRYAAENGYDKIAWTRGEQQVERYTSALRKAVDRVEWEKTPEGIHLVGYKGGGLTETHRETLAALEDAEQHAAARGAVLDDAAQSALDALRRPARRAPAKKVVDTTEKETALSDAIGKSMADRIISDPAQSGTIEGEGIKIDDTGMAGFYDRIVPKVANEVLKKLGGGKVQNFDIRTGKPGYIDETDVEWPTGNETDINKQPGFDITPELRERAMKGMPLFQDKKPGQEAIAGSDDLRGAYTPGENLVELFRASDRSTALHELGHSWLEELKADAALPNASEQLKADWEIARRELAIPASGEIGVASHEQWARSVERYVSEGRAPSTELAGLFARFREWLLTLWKQIRERPVEVSPDLRQVLDRMLATDQQIQEAQDLGVPRAYVDVAKAETARKIIPGDVAKQAAQKPFADELPPGPGEAPDKIHVNYKYINSPTDLKLAMQRLAELDQAEIQKQRGGVEGVKSWAMANAEQQKYLNDVLGGSEDTLHLFAARDPNAPQIDVRLGVMKKLVTGAAREADRLRDIVLEHAYDATVQEQLEYMGALERLRMLQAEFLGERAGVARALNALKDTTEGSGEISRMLEVIGVGDTRLFQRTPAEQNAYLKAKLDEIMLNYKGKSVLDIARLHKEIGTLKGTFKLAKEAAKATTRQKLIEGWKSALLSGPVTHVTNLFGTGAFQVMRPVVDTVAAGIGIMRGARPGERLMAAEGVARLTGYLGGIQDATKVAFHTFMMDQTTGKTESYRNAIEGRKGDIIRIPLRAMAAEDAFVNTMYTRSELRTLAMRQAFAEGRNPRTREYAERVDQLVDNPPPDMKAKADLEATRMTFNADLGEKGRALQLFVNKWNLQWMIPFIRTPINIAKEMARISPFAPLVGEWRAAIRAGGIERDRALAEVAIGSGLMTLAAAWSFAGNLSGAGSPDPGKNRAKVGVWQPYSILVGDTWYEYDRIQPVGTLVGFAADMANVWDHMTPEEMDKIPKMLAVAFSNAVTNQTFLQGITNVINAMSDPTRFAPQFARQLASTAVPNIIGQPTAMADPVVREVNSMLEAIQARIPGAREQLLSKKDWLGEPVETKERLGVISPIRQTSISEDKVRQEAARLDIAVAAAPKKMHIGKGSGKLGDVELTPEERDKFETSGGQMAHGILSNIVNSAGYDQIPDLIKRNIFSNVLAASHRFAAAMALPMDKKMAYIQQITERMTAELQPQQE